MLTWVMILLLTGILLLFAPDFVARNNLVGCMGMVVTLIAAGIGIRMSGLKRGGQREELEKKVKELEKRVSELAGDGKEDVPEQPN